MIIGLVLIIIIVLLFAFKNTLFETIRGAEGTRMILNDKVGEINNKIKECVDKEAIEAINILGKQGGYMNPVSYRSYYGEKISYLCFGIPNTKKCANNGITKIELENELYNYLDQKIKSCINIESYRDDQTYEINIGNYNLNIEILDKNILFNISYPIMLKRNGIEVSNPGFFNIIDIPLGKIQEAVVDVLNAESNGYLDNVLYVVLKKNEFIVIAEKIFPDTIYKVKYKDSNYEFRLAVKGNE